MKLTRLAGSDCDENDCARVSLTEWGTIAVQGDMLRPEGDVCPGPGEAVVEVSVDLFLEAARGLG